MLVAECLTSLLFPFEWTLLYVPIVFTAALVCLDVPVPAIMGLRITRSNGHVDNSDDDDGYSDTSDEATFEVQRCVVHVDTGRIQLPDDMPRFPDRSCFISELNGILSRFDPPHPNETTTTTTTTSAKSRTRVQRSEDWTHLDDQQATENNDEPSQALARLAAIAKRAGIVIDSIEEENR